jgi:hypothetical protein
MMQIPELLDYIAPLTGPGALGVATYLAWRLGRMEGTLNGVQGDVTEIRDSIKDLRADARADRNQRKEG